MANSSHTPDEQTSWLQHSRSKGQIKLLDGGSNWWCTITLLTFGLPSCRSPQQRFCKPDTDACFILNPPFLKTTHLLFTENAEFVFGLGGETSRIPLTKADMRISKSTNCVSPVKHE